MTGNIAALRFSKSNSSHSLLPYKICCKSAELQVCCSEPIAPVGRALSFEEFGTNFSVRLSKTSGRARKEKQQLQVVKYNSDATETALCQKFRISVVVATSRRSQSG